MVVALKSAHVSRRGLLTWAQATLLANIVYDKKVLSVFGKLAEDMDSWTRACAMLTESILRSGMDGNGDQIRMMVSYFDQTNILEYLRSEAFVHHRQSMISEIAALRLLAHHAPNIILTAPSHEKTIENTDGTTIPVTWGDIESRAVFEDELLLLRNQIIVPPAGTNKSNPHLGGFSEAIETIDSDSEESEMD